MMNITFHDPSVWALCLLAILPLLLWRWIWSKGDTVAFSSTKMVAGIRPSLRVRLRWVPGAIRVLALAILILALARPQMDNRETKITSEGIAIEMLVDRSPSMRAEDFQLGGRSVDRLTAVKDVAGKFLLGDKASGLDGRPADLVGLVRFATHADNIAPLTLDHDYLLEQLAETRIADTEDENGTAIGDAVGLAVERLDALSTQRKKEGKKELVGKVLILLTDGMNTAGDLKPMAAAELAKTTGVRIYAIGVGTKGMAPVPVPNPFTGEIQYRNVKVNIDEKTLKAMAKTTDGLYFRATDTESLKDIYAQIDTLEKTKIEQHTVGEIRELAVEPIEWKGREWPSLAMIALALLALDTALTSLVFRRIV